MRLTLEQLQAMSDKELVGRWECGDFPFEGAKCGYCLTNHACGMCKEHQDLVPSRLASPQPMRLRENLEELYALRLFFDSLYPPAVQTEEERHETVAAEQHMETVR